MATLDITSAVPSPTYSNADGRDLAVQLLCELDDMETENCTSIEPDFRKRGEPQRNVALGFIQALIARNDPTLIAGFASVLTDALSECVAAGSLSAERYAALVDGCADLPGTMDC